MRASAAARFCPRILPAGLILVLLAVPALSPAQAILGKEIVEPRTFGYAIGDKIRREVHLTLHPGFQFDPESLPEPGRLDRWLEFASPGLRTEPSGGGLEYHLVLTYQLMNAPGAPGTVTIPQLNLRIVGATHDLTTLVPALRIEVSPLTFAIGADRLNGASLQRDREPVPLPLEARRARLAWMVAALLALGALILWRRGLMAFTARRNLPFAIAVRQLRRLPPGQEAAALKAAHQAINRTAGRVVFAHTLDDFLAAHTAFGGLRDQFRQLFSASGTLFFDDGAVLPAGADVSAVLRLCRQCRSIERRAAAPPGRLHAARN